MKIKVEKGVEIPFVGIKNKPGYKEAISKMGYGDSFVIEGDPYIYSCVRQIASTLNIKLTTRKQPDGTRRVWKIQ